MQKIKIINKSDNDLPSYSTPLSAGMDIRANIDTEIVLKPFERKILPTGIFIELPAGYEAQIRPRSGLAIKKGLSVLNSPGTIDADYRGEIKIILINFSDENITINKGDRIAQMIINRYEKISWRLVEELSPTARKQRGLGHTGVL